MSDQHYHTERLTEFLPDRRYFTVGEANRALVLIRRITADVVRLYAHLGDLQDALETCPDSQAEDVRNGLLVTIERLQGCLEELDFAGVELVDWSRGIVNFPCVADGRAVFLCWEHGQDRIRYWHEAGEGFAERQPIATFPLETMLAVT